MRYILLPLLALALTASMAQAKLNVVATTGDLGSIAQEIGGDRIELEVLGKPTEDPHSVSAKPDFIVKLSHADVVVEGGAGLETGWLPTLLEQAHNSKIVTGAPGHISCATGVPLLNVPAKLDRSGGGIHAAGNPHYVIAPSNAKIVAKNIAEGFCNGDPESADFYRANLKKFDGEIDAKLIEWHKALDPFKGRRMVAYHDSWPYFAKEFGLKIDLFLEPKPGVPPTPAHLAQAIAKMKQENAVVIIVDPYADRNAAQTAARDINAWIVDLTQFPGGIKHTEGGYIPMMDELVKRLTQALAGNV
ncbi:MAG TPA: metal ABC transporter substrate-binding protein [Verrucomicrobiae bacterium]|jgi:zinc/manganese transport system substrate-binding protein|nr:metal ABC transporter substrate-binding protein [Verrucomicrobiae bacterium]